MRSITVSRDALRADLAEMELRLRVYFDQKMAEKAAASELDALVKRVDLHESGVFPPAWELRVRSIMDDVVTTRLSRTWAMRGNKAAWVVGVCAILSLMVAMLAIYLSVHYHGVALPG